MAEEGEVAVERGTAFLDLWPSLPACYIATTSQEMIFMDVQCFIIRACPGKDHPQYIPWQAVTIVLLVNEGDEGMDSADIVVSS